LCLHVKRNELIIQDLEGSEYRDPRETTDEALAASRESLTHAIAQGKDVTEDVRAHRIADDAGKLKALVPLSSPHPAFGRWQRSQRSGVRL
jgi:hypothetical protein